MDKEKLDLLKKELKEHNLVSQQVLHSEYPGLLVSPQEGKKRAYLDHLLETKGKKWVIQAVHDCGFLVFDKNIIPPVKKHQHLGSYAIFENVEGNIFWHRDDVDQDDNFIDNPPEYMTSNKEKNGLSSG